MFTLQSIKAAHGKVKTGADYPAYVQELKAMGITHYDFMVPNGVNNFYGNAPTVTTIPAYSEKQVADTASPGKLAHCIEMHQHGQTDFMTFCRQAADAGVDRWASDLNEMVVIYYDKVGNEMLREPIPAE